MRTLILGLLLSALALVSCGGKQGVTVPSSLASDRLIQMEPGEREPILSKEFECQRRVVAAVTEPVPLVWYVPSTRTLYWVLKGDYNLDGVVNISDITPLAVYFGIFWDFPTEEVVPWWIDGNADRAINIADITPIAAYFFTQAPIGWETSVGLSEQVEGKAIWKVAVPERTNPEEIEITALEPLVLTLVEIDPVIGVIRMGEADWLQFEATAYDQYGDPLDGITWIWWVTNSELGTAQEGLFILGPGAAPGTYPDVIKAEAQQGELRVTGSASVVIEAPPPENHPPEITSFSPSETSLEMDIGTTREFSVEAEDPDEDELTFTWYLDDEVVGEDKNYVFEATAEGVYQIKVVCSDGHGGDDSRTWAITVVEVPSPPELFLRGIGAPLLENGTTVVLQQGEGASWEPFVVLDGLGDFVGYATQMEWSSEMLPSWVFEGNGITTIIWRDPGAGEIEQLLEPGTYNFQVSTNFQDQEVALSATLVVQENPNLP